MSFPQFMGSFSAHLPRSTASQANLTPHLPTGGPTLQDEADELDKEEADWYDHLHEITSFGYNTLIPLGKQHTHDDDQDSSFSSSSRGSSPMLEGEGPGGLEVEDDEMSGGVDLDAEVEERDGDSSTSDQSEPSQDSA